MTRVTYDVRTNKADVVKVNTYAEAQATGRIVKVNYEQMLDEVAEGGKRKLTNFWNQVDTTKFK
mgnify:FL=1